MFRNPLVGVSLVPNPSKNKKLIELAEWFGVFTDPTRIMIIMCLAEDRMTVTDLAKATDTEIVNVSHHLGVMKKTKMVECEKDGRFMIYTLQGYKKEKKVITLTHETGVVVNIPCDN